MKKFIRTVILLFFIMLCFAWAKENSATQIVSDATLKVSDLHHSKINHSGRYVFEICSFHESINPIEKMHSFLYDEDFCRHIRRNIIRDQSNPPVVILNIRFPDSFSVCHENCFYIQKKNFSLFQYSGCSTKELLC